MPSLSLTGIYIMCRPRGDGGGENSGREIEEERGEGWRAWEGLKRVKKGGGR